MTLIVPCGLKREARAIAAAWGDVRIIAGGGDAARLEVELEAAVLAAEAPAASPAALANSSQPTRSYRAEFERSREPSRDSGAVVRVSTGASRLRSMLLDISGGGETGEEEKEARQPNRPRQINVALILSSGIAGALRPALRPGDIVLDGDPEILAILRRALPQATIGTIIGGDAILATAAAKRALHASTGAVAVDMESHIARRVAARHGLRFAALRTISDTAGETLPPAALIGMKPDGSMALGAVLASLARHPGQLPALIRTGIGAEKAFRALGRAHDVLGGLRVELADLGQLRIDMA